MDVDINMHIDMDIDMDIDINTDMNMDIDPDKKEPSITICIKYQIALPSVLLKYGSWFRWAVSQAVWVSPMVAKSIS